MAAPVLSGKDNATIVFTLLANENQGIPRDLDKDSELFERFFDIVSKNTISSEQQKETIEIAEKTVPRMVEKTKTALGMAQITPEMFVSIFSILG